MNFRLILRIPNLARLSGFASLALLVSTSGMNLAWSTEYGKQHLNLCEKLVRDTERVQIAPIARPPHMRLFREPAFRTLARRISDSAPGQVSKPAGNPAQAWNIDESLLILHRYSSGDVHEIVLLNGMNYQELRVLDIPDVQSENLFWSHTNPSLLYFVAESGKDAGKLTQLNVNNQERTVLTDFAPVCQAADLSARSGLLAKPSYDGNTFGYQCAVSGQRSLGIAYNANTDTTHTLTLRADGRFAPGSAPAPSPDGTEFWLQGSVLNAELQSLKTVDMADWQSSITLSAKDDGSSVVYQASTKPSPEGCNGDLWNGIGLLVEHTLDNVHCKSLVNQTDTYPETPQGTELFASAYRSPAWLAMSSVGYDNLTYLVNKRSAPLLFSEIYIADTSQEDVQICRLAHHRSFGMEAKNASYDPVMGEPNVTLSPTATRILFSSDWYDSGFVDSYVLELPSFSRFELTGQWEDENNSAIKTDFIQIGEKITYRRHTPATGNNPDIISSGSGLIQGSKLALEYEVHASRNRKLSGECTSTLSGKPSTLELTCNDAYSGRTNAVLIRQP